MAVDEAAAQCCRRDDNNNTTEQQQADGGNGLAKGIARGDYYNEGSISGKRRRRRRNQQLCLGENHGEKYFFLI
jgi:hypothetical protein